MKAPTRTYGLDPSQLKRGTPIPLTKLEAEWDRSRRGEKPPIRFRSEMIEAGLEWMLRYFEAAATEDKAVREELFLEALEKAEVKADRIFLLLNLEDFLLEPLAKSARPLWFEGFDYFSSMNRHRMKGLDACLDYERVLNSGDVITAWRYSDFSILLKDLDLYESMLKFLCDEYQFILPKGATARQLPSNYLHVWMEMLLMSFNREFKSDKQRWRKYGVVLAQALEDHIQERGRRGEHEFTLRNPKRNLAELKTKLAKQ